jgi:hypothetical protein|tara:strand:- start:968 stop:1159 length:192 start_codon:yes stop_codon:yes gene_type:complete
LILSQSTGNLILGQGNGACPKVTVDSPGREPVATELANLRVERIAGLNQDQVTRILRIMQERG